MDELIRNEADVLSVLKCIQRTSGSSESTQMMINYIVNGPNDQDLRQIQKITRRVFENCNFNKVFDVSLLRVFLKKLLNVHKEGFGDGMCSSADILLLSLLSHGIVLTERADENYSDNIFEVACIYKYIVYIVTELNSIYDDSLFETGSERWIIKLASAKANRKQRKVLLKALENNENQKVLEKLKEIKLEDWISLEVCILIDKARLIIDSFKDGQKQKAQELEKALVLWLRENKGRLDIEKVQ